MAKPTKAEKKRLAKAILSKAQKLWVEGLISTKDFISVEAIVKRSLKRIG